MTEPDEAMLYAREHWATICDEDGFPEVAEAYRRGVNDEALATDALFYRAGAAAYAERIKELEAALAKANEPRWFYADGEGIAWRSMEEAVEESCDDLEHGRHLVEIETARPCPTIWGVVHVFTKTELEDQHRDGGPFEGKPYNLTVCATEAAARALLKETDQ